MASMYRVGLRAFQHDLVMSCSIANIISKKKSTKVKLSAQSLCYHLALFSEYKQTFAGYYVWYVRTLPFAMPILHKDYKFTRLYCKCCPSPTNKY